MLPIRQKIFFTKLLNFSYWTPLSKVAEHMEGGVVSPEQYLLWGLSRMH